MIRLPKLIAIIVWLVVLITLAVFLLDYLLMLFPTAQALPLPTRTPAPTYTPTPTRIAIYAPFIQGGAREQPTPIPPLPVETIIFYCPDC